MLDIKDFEKDFVFWIKGKPWESKRLRFTA